MAVSSTERMGWENGSRERRAKTIPLSEYSCRDIDHERLEDVRFDECVFSLAGACILVKISLLCREEGQI